MNVYVGNRLPSTYQEVEYIESSGTQYIDAGLKLSNNTKVAFDIAFTANRSGWTGIIGAQTYNNNHSFAIGINNSGTATYQNRLASGNRFIDFSFNPTLNQKYRINTNDKYIYVDGVLKGTFSADTESYTTEYNARIFDVYQSYNGGFPYKVSARLYNCKIYSGTTLQRDFVPCYRKSDSAIGLYDLVNSAFYTNAGSGSFSKGSDVLPSLSYPLIGDNPIKAIYQGSNLIRPKGYTITGSTVYAEYTPTQFSDIQGCYISNDGTNMYLSFWNSGTGKLGQYILSRSNDVSSAIYVRSIGITKPDGIFFSNDGTKFFFGSEQDYTIKRYSLSTAWDISTATQDQSISAGVYYAWQLTFSEDGKNLYYSSRDSSQVWRCYRKNLSTAWDLTSVVSTTNVMIKDTYRSVAVRGYGKYFYQSNEQGTDMVQYKLSTPYDITGARTGVGTFNIGTSSNDGRGFFVTKDFEYWTFGMNSSGTVLRQYKAQRIS